MNSLGNSFEYRKTFHITHVLFFLFSADGFNELLLISIYSGLPFWLLFKSARPSSAFSQSNASDSTEDSESLLSDSEHDDEA